MSGVTGASCQIRREETLEVRKSLKVASHLGFAVLVLFCLLY